MLKCRVFVVLVEHDAAPLQPLPETETEPNILVFHWSTPFLFSLKFIYHRRLIFGRTETQDCKVTMIK